jgi:MerR family transcriptional regulator, redox-sensitive transcriptional activator SoxR
MLKTYLSIGEVAQQAEITASAIRYYESIGILPSPERINGQRRYTHEVIEQLKFIKIAQSVGFSNQEISLLIEDFDKQAPPSEMWKQMAATKRSELEGKIKQIYLMIEVLKSGLACQCLTWSECLSKINSNQSKNNNEKV